MFSACLGLVLAVIGVYGLISQFVALQRREFGIRVAIGAGPGDILRVVLVRAMWMIAAGVLAGTLATLLLVKRFGLQLGVSDPFDATSIGGAGAILIAVGLAACLGPAIRAAKTDPAIVLRLE